MDCYTNNHKDKNQRPQNYNIAKEIKEKLL